MAVSKFKILFLCTGNSCRSQMAEGFAKALKSQHVEAYSAGTKPQGLNPLAVKVMAEEGIDITKQESQHVDGLTGLDFDYVISVCDAARESCPIFSGKMQKIHVGFEDPPHLAKDCRTEEEALVHYRRVRDEIKRFIETFPEGLQNNPE